MSARKDYWIECVSDALEDAGVVASADQIELIAHTVEGAHENYGMAFGDDVATSNWLAANEREKTTLKKEIVFEHEKVSCPSCGGAGRLKYNAGPWGVNTGCSKCQGDGKLHPSQI